MAPPNGLMVDRRRPDDERRPPPPGTPAVPQPQSMAGTDGMDKAMSDMTQRGMPTAPTGGPPGQPRGNGLMQRRPAPVTMDREGNAVPGVSGRLQTLTDSDSPYIRRARTRARQGANRRGLMNSSIAAGAGEAAAIDAALPIAQADANIAANERAMRSQEFQQLRSIRSQELMQERGLDHDAAQKEADRELSQLLQARDHRVQQLMQQRGFDHDAAQAHADRELQSTLQRRAQAHARMEARRQREFAGEQAGLDRDLQRELQGGTTESTERLARDNAVRDINSEYQRHITALSLNTEIPVEERRALEEHYAFIRDQSMEAVAQIYDFEPEWTSARQPEDT